MEAHKLGRAIKHSVSSENGIRLEYFLYRSYGKVGGKYSYSVAMSQTESGDTENVYAGDIARTRTEACRIFRLLSEGFVTACTFFEILDEIL